MRIVMLRHGQYKRDPETLTRLGRYQARLAGKRLREFSFHEIHVSTMPRALETAKLVMEQLGRRKNSRATPLLRECLPGFPMKDRRAAGITDVKRLQRDKIQAEKAFRKFFANRPGKNILLVCHGNIIRYFVCRALGVNPLAWTSMDIHQCGFTIVQLSERTKRLELITHNDVSHIPKNRRTFV